MPLIRDKQHRHTQVYGATTVQWTGEHNFGVVFRYVLHTPLLALLRDTRVKKKKRSTINFLESLLNVALLISHIFVAMSCSTETKYVGEIGTICAPFSLLSRSKHHDATEIHLTD